MYYRATILSTALFCLSVAGIVPSADATAYTVRTKRCGTAELTPLPSEDPDLKLYLFKESGTLRPVGVVSNTPLPGALAKTTYVCQGILLTDSFQLMAGTYLTRSATASCVFRSGPGNRMHARAVSAGASSSGTPPQPPVKFGILHGTGWFAGIKGSGIGAGFLPISDQSTGAETCATVNWNVRFPNSPGGI